MDMCAFSVEVFLGMSACLSHYVFKPPLVSALAGTSLAGKGIWLLLLSTPTVTLCTDM